MSSDFKTDARPMRYLWAPGGYVNVCKTCNDDFIGDKRAQICADCAYALPDPSNVPPLPEPEPIDYKSRAEALAELVEKLKTACELTLLFHSGSPWDFEKQNKWANLLTDLMGSASSRDPRIVGANGDGTWDGAMPTNEATTKNLCNAQRAAIRTLDALLKNSKG